MKPEDRIKTLSLALRGLWENEEEVQNFASFCTAKLSLKRPSILKRAYYYYFKTRKINNYQSVLNKIVDVRRQFKEWKDIEKPGRPRFLIRVDDFPSSRANLEKFKDFHHIFQKHGLPYLLGVTPLLSENPLDPANKELKKLTNKEIEFLKEPLIELGLHGITHQTLSHQRHSEFVDLSPEQKEKKLKQGIEEMESYGFSPQVLIPPFNSLSKEGYKIAKQHFKAITGGPETIRTLGFQVTPCYLMGSLYVPSYYYVYGRAERILNFLNSADISEEIVIPITLHWAWEIKNDFKGVKKLCDFVKGKELSWNNFLEN